MPHGILTGGAMEAPRDPYSVPLGCLGCLGDLRGGSQIADAHRDSQFGAFRSFAKQNANHDKHLRFECVRGGSQIADAHRDSQFVSFRSIAKQNANHDKHLRFKSAQGVLWRSHRVLSESLGALRGTLGRSLRCLGVLLVSLGHPWWAKWSNSYKTQGKSTILGHHSPQ